MLNLGIAQIINSTDINKNFNSIWQFLESFESRSVDLILFPECSLSGFSAKIKECSLELLEPYLSKISEWSLRTGIDVILPTAVVDDKIYNSGFIFSAGKREQFYKLGLTESEQKFFSLPKKPSNKKFQCKNYKFGLLICMEAQQEAWNHFTDDEVDFILWPGYWGWEKDDEWIELKSNNEENLVFQNMLHWKKPLIQSNFALNDFGDSRKNGPKGLSVVINNDNQLHFKGEYEKESAFIVSLEKLQDVTIVRKVTPI